MVIALLTDFHNSDGLGLVKGVIHKICPGAKIVDLYNHVEPFQIRSGAWVLLQDYTFFPKGTIFFAVVDPGVGGKRKCVAIETNNYYFVGPDNGLIYPAASKDGIVGAVELAIPENAAKTFHGRDVFAPAAAKLENGVSLQNIGKKMSAESLKPLNFEGKKGMGEIILIEHYGNITTTIPPIGKKERYDVEIGNYKNNLNYHETFEEAKENELFIFTGSRGTLELAVKNGRADAIIKAKIGDKLKIS